MKPSIDGHLSRDQIILATVDPGDLSEDRRVHLERCERCKQVLDDMRESLTRLGTQARMSTPAPSRPVRIDQRKKRAPLIRFGRIAGLSAAVVAVIMVAIVWTTMNGRISSQIGSDTPFAGVADDSALMEEVARLVEDPLPDRYRNLIDADAGNLESDFMEFIVPAV